MSERTGLGPLEVALLLTLEDLGARPDRPYVKSAKALADVNRRFGIPPAYAYRTTCDLAASWTVSVPLVDGHGNLGTPGHEPANPRYTELRLTAAGASAVAAERHQAPSVPIGLINGDMYAGGERPSFRPAAVVRALLALLADSDIDDASVLEICGPPAFPTGCDVGGEVDAVLNGRPGVLRLTARVMLVEGAARPVLHISSLPPGVHAGSVLNALTARTEQGSLSHLPHQLGSLVRLPITDVNDHGSGDEELIVCALRPDAQPDDVVHRVKNEVWGVHVDVPAALPASLPDLLRRWITDEASEGTEHTRQGLNLP